MSETNYDPLQVLKTSCDNDTILFHFKGSTIGEAFSRGTLHKVWKSYYDNGEEVELPDGYNDSYTYYYKRIVPRMVNEMILNIYYKNTNGIWVDYKKCRKNYPNVPIQIAAITYVDIVKVDPIRIPACVFMDDNNYIHNIDEYDGNYNEYKVPIIDIDEGTTVYGNAGDDVINKDKYVTYTPFSLKEPYLPFSARHIMPDLKVKVKGIPSDSLFVWLNGLFVPITQDNTYEDVFYIKNAMALIGSRCLNQKLNAPINRTSKATVTLDDTFNEYRLDTKFRFFSWKNVKLSPWYAPQKVGLAHIYHNYTSIPVIKEITFPVPINKNAHVIIENGVILDSSEYTISPSDDKKITLNYVEINAYSFLYEVIKDLKSNPEIYGAVKPLKLVEPALSGKSYSLINFTSSDETDIKKLYLKHSVACTPDFPYKNEITFASDIDLGDLITINGTFNEYEWIHKRTISYPIFKYSYNGPEGKLLNKDIIRYYFICK